MKISIEAEPEELAEMMSIFADKMNKTIKKAEEDIAMAIIAAKGQKLTPINKESEVPSGGYFH